MREPRLTGEIRRRAADVVGRRLADEPVIALHGIRTGGKSTLLDQIASTAERERIDLDDAGTLLAVEGDPLLFARGPAPVCIDEYQRAPAILDAIKAELNNDLRPGRFVLTGSTTYESLPLTAQSLTGRLHRIIVWPFSQGEVDGVHETFVEQLLDEPSQLVSSAISTTSRDEYLDRAAQGGMPLALARSTAAARSRWFNDLIELIVTRDVVELSRIRQRRVLPLLLRQLATQTAQTLVMATASEKLGIDKSTGENYTALLESAFLIHRLPAWGNSAHGRITKRPKVHLVDSGLASHLLRITPEKLARRNPSVLTELGHLLETFVINEILKQASWLDLPVTAEHLRTRDDEEVDLVLERDDGGIVGVEVKSASSVPKTEFKGLRKLREMAGEAFLGGVVLYLGQRSYTYDDRLHVMPIDRLWTP